MPIDCTPIETILHSYMFYLGDAGVPDIYKAFKTERLQAGALLFESISKDSHYLKEYDGLTLKLNTEYVFDNQWDADLVDPVTGLSKTIRVFDWALDAPQNGSKQRTGHYLDMTDAMKAVRAARQSCRYCGKQSLIAEDQAAGKIFCEACLGSPYLKRSDLNMLRLTPIMVRHSHYPELSEPEKTWLVPRYEAAQSARRQRKAAQQRERLTADFHKAEIKYRGLLWLIDHDVETDNVIYRDHKNTFTFGWLNSIDADSVAALTAKLDGFPYPFEINAKAIEADVKAVEAS